MRLHFKSASQELEAALRLVWEARPTSLRVKELLEEELPLYRTGLRSLRNFSACCRGMRENGILRRAFFRLTARVLEEALSELAHMLAISPCIPPPSPDIADIRARGTISTALKDSQQRIQDQVKELGVYEKCLTLASP